MRKSFKIKNLIRNNRYAFLSRGEEKNLLANEMSLQILGGGQLCGSNEPTPSRISKFAGSLRNSALPLGEGGHSPLLHSGCPLQLATQHAPFRHTAAVSLHPRGRRRLAGGHSPLLYIGHPRKSNRPFSTSSRNGKECVRRALLPCGISNENWCGMTT